ncbi:hypothetical protein QUF99_06500 [Bacillus sp. DX4.1]|uniref:EAL domain-containing protein n=1 Tax=Bacillus sp. DX4.1 TaxID=3055867 RepID=UPI0025A28797|nr:EAL domain-containing protein [Bacillus sp. DX4.1]MDM5187002.1 hypothetical protein [Bacillus sp. DX4.1]
MRAKELGKGNYQFYCSGLNVHRVLERNEFSLCYQQQINIMTEAMTGMEALLRWNNEELPPPNFFTACLTLRWGITARQ